MIKNRVYFKDGDEETFRVLAAWLFFSISALFNDELPTATFSQFSVLSMRIGFSFFAILSRSKMELLLEWMQSRYQTEFLYRVTGCRWNVCGSDEELERDSVVRTFIPYHYHIIL